nr:SDR family NAD(P)-dependent oxidoreductase [Bacillus subtilis]
MVHHLNKKTGSDNSYKSSDIAIIGISCRFPDANDYHEFWENIHSGKDSIREVPLERWNPEQYYSADINIPNKSISKWGGFIEQARYFDHKFFHISPREAKNMDPEQRILLEETWRCIEDSGVSLSELQDKTTSVFTGIMNSDYRQMGCADSEIDSYACLGSFESILSNRISFAFDFTGKSMSVNAACASSLVALDEAVRSLREKESDFAIASGVNLNFQPWKYISFSKARMLSPDGKCKSFDAAANGYVPGEGAGVLLIQRLDEAVKAGHHIYGIIKGTAVNHGGKTRSITAPSVDAQCQVILAALKSANVDASTISYIEAHGTGTSLGDPIEIEALTKAYLQYTDHTQYCRIGSVKTNIGHLEAAAGMAGLIKVLMMMKHRRIPKTLNVNMVNPIIQFEKTPFVLAMNSCDWQAPDGEPLRAGISSFGFGGVNSHVIIEEFIHKEVSKASCNGKIQPFLFSAKSEKSMEQMLQQWKLFSGESEEFQKFSHEEISSTLLTGRATFEYRAGILADSKAELRNHIENGLTIHKKNDCKWILVIGDLKWESYEQFTEIKRVFPNIEKEVEKMLQGISTVDYTFKEKWTTEKSRLYSVVINTAIVKSMLTAGFRPSCITGVGDGYFIALAVAGILKIENVYAFIANVEKAAALFCDPPSIPFLSPYTAKTYFPVQLDENYIRMLLNGIQFSVESAIHLRKKAQLLLKHQYTFKGYIEEWEKSAHSQQISVLKNIIDGSGFSGEKLTDEEVVTLVAILASLQRLYKKWDLTEQEGLSENRYSQELLYLIDAGVLSKELVMSMLLKQPEGIKQAVKYLQQAPSDFYEKDRFPLMVDHNQIQDLNQEITDLVLKISEKTIEPNRDIEIPNFCTFKFGTLPLTMNIKHEAYFEPSKSPDESLYQVFMQMWLKGEEIVWARLGDHNKKKVVLPVYPFERYHFDLKPEISKTDAFSVENIKRSLYAPVWKESPLSEVLTDGQRSTILLFSDHKRYSEVLQERENTFVYLVTKGDRFEQISDDVFTINRENPEDYISLIRLLKQKNAIPDSILHAWADKQSEFDEALQTGIYSVFYLTKALISENLINKVRLIYVFSNDKEKRLPCFEGIGGFFKSVKQEYPELCCKAIRFTNGSMSISYSEESDILYKEIDAAPDHNINIMYKDGVRYAQVLEKKTKTNFSPVQYPGKDKVYLITGGLGGIGSKIAEYCAKSETCTIILSGRSPLRGKKQKLLEFLNQFNAEVFYMQADISDKETVIKLVDDIMERYSGLSGIIHCAGVIRDSFLFQKTKQELSEVIAPKVQGTLYLDNATKEIELDFFAVFSSVVSIAGNEGQTDYAYANSFLDHFAEYREQKRQKSQRNGRTLTINWPLWKEIGMGVSISDQARTSLFRDSGLEELSSEAGADWFAQIVMSGQLHNIAVCGDSDRFEQFMEQRFQTNYTQISDTIQLASGDVKIQTRSFLASIISAEVGVKPEEIDHSVHLAEYGMDSVMIHQCNSKLEQALGAISKTLLFEFQTITDLADYLIKEYPDRLESLFPAKKKEKLIQSSTAVNPAQLHIAPVMKEKEKHDGIAVIGISGRYPGAENIEELWDVLSQKKDTITEVPIERWDAHAYYDSDPAKAQEGKIYCKWGGFLPSADSFDSLFFHISPREAEAMDPQERIFLETVWKAFEDSGYTLNRLQKTAGKHVGVFAGVTTNSYKLLGERIPTDKNTVIPNSFPWSLANRVSYTFDFTGPSVPVDTACSSSLTAIHMACESLKKGECSIAVAGGVNLYLHPSDYLYRCQMGMLSKTGQCRSFGAGGDGFVPGEGVGAVILKPLKDAIRDNDTVYTVIKGTAINHGGKTNGYTVPNPAAQASLIQEALAAADWSARSIGYIEAHGTGTPLGDPIEVRGLTKAFREYTDESSYCSLGSIKSNIGHLEAAAGIAGLTKIILQMKYKKIAATLHAERIHPDLHLDETPFHLQQETSEWVKLTDEKNPEKTYPRRAGLSSFGAGGSNAHILVEEYEPPAISDTSWQEGEELIVLSAKHPLSLQEYAKQLAGYLQRASQKHDHSLVKAVKEEFKKAAEKCGVDIKTAKSTDWQSDLFMSWIDEIYNFYNLRSRQPQDTEDFTAERFLEQNKKQVSDFYEQEGLYKNVGLSNIAFTLLNGREPMSERLAIISKDVYDLISKLNKYINGDTDQSIFRGKKINQKRRQKQNGIQMKADKRTMAEMAEYWVSGGDLAWEDIHIERAASKIALPTYPFLKNKLWVSKSVHMQKKELVDPDPLFNFSEGESRFNKKLSSSDYYLKDHIINGEFVLPGAAVIEAAREAAERLNGKQVVKLSQIVWSLPITVQEEKTIAIDLLPNQEGSSRFIVKSNLHSETAVHSQGKLKFYEAEAAREIERFELNNLLKEQKSTINGDECYKSFKQAGLNYGSSYQVIKQLFILPNAVLSRISLADNLQLNGARGMLNPCLLDGIFQSTIGFTLEHDGGQVPYLPFELGELEILSAPSDSGYAYVIPADEKNASSVKRFNIMYMDDKGQVSLKLRNLALKALKSPQHNQIVKTEHSITYYKDKWVQEFNHHSDEICRSNTCLAIVLHDDITEQHIRNAYESIGLKLIFVRGGNQFKEKGIYSYELNSHKLDDYKTLLGILTRRQVTIGHVVLFGKSPETKISHDIKSKLNEAVFPVFYITKALISVKPKNKIKISHVFFTEKNQVLPYQMALSGLFQALHLEQPMITGRNIEICSGQKLLLNGLLPELDCIVKESVANDSGSTEIRYVDGIRYVKKSVSIKYTDGISKVEIEENGVYLITGGAGGLGLIFAKHLIQKGRIKIVLIGRSELSEESVRCIKELEASGSEIFYVKTDISEEKNTADLINLIKSKLGSLKGIIHSAGVIRDSLLINKREEDVRAVLASKVHGTIWLDQYTAKEPLDFFVLFSSISAKIGNAGQTDYAYANRFMDYFAELRAAEDKPGKTLSINWPLWKEGGMQVDRHSERFLYEHFGMLSLGEQEGLSAFDKAMTGCEHQIMVFSGNELKLERIIGIAEEKGNREAIEENNEPDRTISSLRNTLARIICTVLKINESEFDFELPISEYGFDSIMFTMLGNELNESLGISIMPSQFFDFYDFYELLDYIHDECSQEQVQNNLLDHENKNTREYLKEEIAHIISALLKIERQEIEGETSFGEYGFDSITFTRLGNEINQRYGTDLLPSIFFEYNSLDEVAGYLIDQYGDSYSFSTDSSSKTDAEKIDEVEPSLDYDDGYADLALTSSEENSEAEGTLNEPVAIVGISGRFPQSDTIEELWEQIEKGRDLITDIPEDRWDWREFDGDPIKERNKTNIKRGGFINDADKFDPLFFGISPAEAELMDPQQRIFIETVWKAIEDAGYKPSDLAGTKTAVFAGVATTDYAERLSENLTPIQAQTATGLNHCILANRISYLLNITGPSEPVDTACSSSLVALHRAAEGIQRGEFDMAIAGGVHIMTSPTLFIAFDKAGMLAKDGKCKTFDRRADGYVRSEGAAAVLLKPLSKAQADGDHIYGLIKGTAINHGGHANSLTAPNPKAQVDLLTEAWRKTGVSPATVGYIEAHGTGTSLGDPIEVNSIVKAFKTLYEEWGIPFTEQKSCGIGSVKTNIGHLETAAGIAGVIKVLLAFKYQKLPGIVNFSELNPYIKLDGTPFYITDTNEKWKRMKDELYADIPMRAGVSSFGFGGVNAHIVLEEYREKNRRISESGRNHIFVLSAKTKDQLLDYIKLMIQYLDHAIRKEVSVNLTDMASTLQNGREEMEERIAICASDIRELRDKYISFLEFNKKQEGVFINENKKKYTVITEELLLEAIQSGKEELVAQWWAEGAKVNWRQIFNKTYNKMPLPSYPFARESYWFRQKIKNVELEKRIHPLLSENLSTLKSLKFKTNITGSEFFITDHLVSGRPVLPGAAYLEMALVSAEIAAESTICKIKDVVWNKPITYEGTPFHIYSSLQMQKDKLNITICTGEPEGELQICSQSIAEFEESNIIRPLEHFDIELFKHSSDTKISRKECYQHFSRMGLDYRSGFQSLTAVYCSGQEVLAELVLPEQLKNDFEHFKLHPSLIDGGFQSVAFLLNDNDKGSLYVPYSLEELVICSPLEEKCFARVKETGFCTYSIQFINEDGEIAASMNNFSVRKVNAGGLLPEDSEDQTILLLLKQLKNGELSADQVYQLLEVK